VSVAGGGEQLEMWRSSFTGPAIEICFSQAVGSLVLRDGAVWGDSRPPLKNFFDSESLGVAPLLAGAFARGARASSRPTTKEPKRRTTFASRPPARVACARAAF